jgi:hypothetical protein
MIPCTPEEYKVAHARILEAIDAAGLNPALKQLTWEEMASCMVVYAFLESRKRRPRNLKQLRQAFKTVRRAKSECSWRPELGTALKELQEELEFVKQPSPDMECFDNLPKVGGLTVAEHYNGAQGLSAFEVLAGRMLPAVFEKYCGRPARYTRNAHYNSYSGQYVTFARIVLQVLGVRPAGPFSDGDGYADASIVEALRKVRRLNV